MALETPEMDRLVTFHRLSKKNLGKNNKFSMFFDRFGHLPKIPKEFKGNQREIKGNVKGNQGKSKEIKGNQRNYKGDFWKMFNPT